MPQPCKNTDSQRLHPHSHTAHADRPLALPAQNQSRAAAHSLPMGASYYAAHVHARRALHRPKRTLVCERPNPARLLTTPPNSAPAAPTKIVLGTGTVAVPLHPGRAGPWPSRRSDIGALPQKVPPGAAGQVAGLAAAPRPAPAGMPRRKEGLLWVRCVRPAAPSVAAVSPAGLGPPRPRPRLGGRAFHYSASS